MLLLVPVGMEVDSAVASAAVVVEEASGVAAATAVVVIVLAVLAVELVIKATGTDSVDRPLLTPLQAQVVEDAEASEVVTAVVVAGLIVE